MLSRTITAIALAIAAVGTLITLLVLGPVYGMGPAILAMLPCGMVAAINCLTHRNWHAALVALVGTIVVIGAGMAGWLMVMTDDPGFLVIPIGLQGVACTFIAIIALAVTFLTRGASPARPE